jgi:opacity protein-like surface antigen
MLIRKTILIPIFVLASGLGSAHAGPMSETQVGVELLQLERDSDPDVVYLWDNNGTVTHTDDTVVDSTATFDDSADTGYRVSAVRKLTEKWSIHGAYTTTGELDESKSFSDPAAQLTVFWNTALTPTDHFDSADFVQANYTSEQDNFEVNAVYAMSERIDLFAGVSKLNLDESFKIYSIDTGTAGSGQYNIHTSNELLGAQLGINMNFPATEKFDIYLLAKMGWYNNSSEQRQILSDPVLASNRDVKVSDDTSATAYELRLGGTYDFGNNILINLGYQYQKITDVALAESQFDGESGGTTLSNDDDITWQGLHLGVNYYF